MKDSLSFYKIGTSGFVITALLHMLLALGFELDVHNIFISGYAVFGSFLAIGAGGLLKQNVSCDDKV